MVSSGLLGAVAGFLGALVALGVPLVAFIYRIDKRAGKAVRLLTGDDEIEDDGVIPRLRRVEDDVDHVETALEETPDVEYPVRTDGGPDHDS